MQLRILKVIFEGFVVFYFYLEVHLLFLPKDVFIHRFYDFLRFYFIH